MSTVKVWCVQCLCGQSWVWSDKKRITCDCGAVLVRDGVSNCHAEVDKNTYDLTAAQNKQPYIWQEDFEVES